jgi:hypothetical protein
MAFLIVGLIAGWLAGCGGESQETAAAPSACGENGIVVSDAWARAARAGQPTGAAYITLCNGGPEDDALVGASVEGVTTIELHVTSVSEDGVSSMAQAKQIALPAGKTVALAPGGAHLMLIGVTEAISEETPPVIRLEFETAEAQDVRLEVRAEHGEHHH